MATQKLEITLCHRNILKYFSSVNVLNSYFFQDFKWHNILTFEPSGGTAWEIVMLQWRKVECYFSFKCIEEELEMVFNPACPERDPSSSLLSLSQGAYSMWNDSAFYDAFYRACLSVSQRLSVTLSSLPPPLIGFQERHRREPAHSSYLPTHPSNDAVTSCAATETGGRWESTAELVLNQLLHLPSVHSGAACLSCLALFMWGIHGLWSWHRLYWSGPGQATPPASASSSLTSTNKGPWWSPVTSNNTKTSLVHDCRQSPWGSLSMWLDSLGFLWSRETCDSADITSILIGRHVGCLAVALLVWLLACELSCLHPRSAYWFHSAPWEAILLVWP